MKLKEYRFLVRSDMHRYFAKTSLSMFINLILTCPGFKFTFWMRTNRFLSDSIAVRFTLYPFAKIILNHYKYKYGIDISPDTNIGSGFYIGHFGGIVVNHACKIGKNCNISQGVTLGQINRGDNKGFPIIGNNVYIGPGAKIIGNVMLGDSCMVGANCVVTKCFPANSVIVGVPGKVISNNGTEGYINNTEYE